MGCLVLTLGDGEKVIITHRGEFGYIRALLVSEPGRKAHDFDLAPNFPPSFEVTEVRHGDTRFFIDRGKDTLRVGGYLFKHNGMMRVRVILDGDAIWDFVREDAKKQEPKGPLSRALRSRPPSAHNGSPSDAKP